jgi:hypothetical protein
MSVALKNLKIKLEQAEMNLEKRKEYNEGLSKKINESNKELLNAQIAVAIFSGAVNELEKALAEEENG